MPWWHAVAERDHELQNPTTEAKLRELGERLRLNTDSRVVDLAAGKCGPALVLASAFGCTIVAVERAPEFVEAARTRIEAAGLGRLIELHEHDASEFPLEPASFDAALCLGASFVWGGLGGTLAALEPAVRAGGHVVVGEPYWRRWPLPVGEEDDGFTSLAETVGRFEAAGLQVDTLIASSVDDWDRYESLHWRAVEDWLADHPDHADAPEFRRLNDQYRRRYLAMLRESLGWAIFAGRKPFARS